MSSFWQNWRFPCERLSCLGPKLERESLQRPIKKMYWFIGPHHYNRDARSAPLSSLDYIRKYACNNASQSKHESLHLRIRVKHGCRWPSWLCVRTSKLQNLQNEVQQQQLGTGSRPAPLAQKVHSESGQDKAYAFNIETQQISTNKCASTIYHPQDKSAPAKRNLPQHKTFARASK